MTEYTCVFCGHQGEDVKLETDHSISHSWGIASRPDNQTICSGCFEQKGTMPSIDYRRWRQKNPETANRDRR